jgi:hypothetical protein
VAQLRVPVRKIREVLRLRAAEVSDRQVAMAIGSARSTVQECVRRAREPGLAWPLADELDLDEGALQRRLYRREGPLSSRPRPNFPHIHAELSRPGVTRRARGTERGAPRVARAPQHPPVQEARRLSPRALF